jgi:nitrogen-specific signal transduction histidine kinase
MAVRAVPILNPDGSVREWVGVHSDVTERRQLEDQFRQAQKMEAIGRLAGGVAHDFNNLLTVIAGYADIAQRELPAGHPAQEPFREIAEAADRAAGLTRQLLAFSRQSVLEPRVFDPTALVRDMSRMLSRLIGEDIDLALELSADAGPIRADPRQLEQAVMNLCVNARDAMPHGGRLTVAITSVDLDPSQVGAPADVRPGRYVVLTVQDTGVGMTPDILARVFEPFFTTKEVGKGTGLGLAMVYGFVRQSGGYITLASEAGQGTVVTIYLPQVAAAPARHLKSETNPMPQGEETILVVEDEAALRGLTVRVLRKCGYTVLEAVSGPDALRVMDRHTGPLHLLVTDVVMPGGMGGRQTAEAITARHPGVRVLFVSGYSNDAIILEDRAHFLQKPYSPAALAAKVRAVLDEPTRLG